MGVFKFTKISNSPPSIVGFRVIVNIQIMKQRLDSQDCQQCHRARLIIKYAQVEDQSGNESTFVVLLSFNFVAHLFIGKKVYKKIRLKWPKS